MNLATQRRAQGPVHHPSRCRSFRGTAGGRALPVSTLGPSSALRGAVCLRISVLNTLGSSLECFNLLPGFPLSKEWANDTPRVYHTRMKTHGAEEKDSQNRQNQMTRDD